MTPIDDIDKSIIDVLKQNARLSTREISKRTEIPMATVNRRFRKLVDSGIIRKFGIELDYEKLGTNLLAYILLRTTHGADFWEIYDEAMKHKEVEDICSLTGQFDVMLRIRTKGVDEFSDFLFRCVRKLPNVVQTETMLALKVKRNRR